MRARVSGALACYRCGDPNPTICSTWGAWLLIRTGPAAFNKAIVTPTWQGGLLPSGFEWKDGFKLHRFGGRVDTPTEESVFEALGLEYKAPAVRAAAGAGL